MLPPKKYFRTIIFCLILLIAGLVIALARIDRIPPPPIIATPENLPFIYIQEQKVISSVTPIFVSAQTLSPRFKIVVNDGNEITSVRLDGISLFGENAPVEDVHSTVNSLDFVPEFLIKPGEHSLEVGTAKESIQREIAYKFILSFAPDLSTNIEKSQFLLIPDTTLDAYPQSWVSTKEGVLKVNSLEGSELASVAFIYPFTDLDLSFDLKPKGPKINLVFYFLERGRTIVIGDGNNRRITLLRSGQISVPGKDFILETNKEYEIRISRKKNIYEAFINSEKVLSFEDSTDTNESADSVGFSVWPGSDGVEIKNLVVFPIHE
jgi:hypothetical protein